MSYWTSWIIYLRVATSIKSLSTKFGSESSLGSATHASLLSRSSMPRYRRWIVTLKSGRSSSKKFKNFPDIIAQYLGIQRPVGAHSASKPCKALWPEEIFYLMTAEDHYLIHSSMLRKSLSDFWGMRHLIFIHNIDPRLHDTKHIAH